MALRLSVLVVAATLGGCAQNDARVADGSTPEHADWWKRYDDPVLTNLVREAVSDALGSASADLIKQRAAAAEPDTALAFADPKPASETPFALGYRGVETMWSRLATELQPPSQEEKALKAACLELIDAVARAFVEARGLQAQIALAEEARPPSPRQIAALKARYDDAVNRLSAASGVERQDLSLRLEYTDPLSPLR